jgi:hypothetical protein
MSDDRDNREEPIEERQQHQRADLRAELDSELSNKALREFDMMSELWDSGEMQEMLDNGDFSDIPDELRPNHDD